METETITSFDDLIGLLERNPQYRSRLRQSILDEEFQRLPEQVRALSEFSASQAERMDQLTERMDQLTERMDQLTERMDQLTERMDQLTERLDQLTKRMDQLTERLDQLTERMNQLSERMVRFTEHMDERMLSQEGRTDWLMGAEAERRFRERAAAYFGHLLRRLHVVDSSALADLIDDAIDAGSFAAADREPLMRLDVVARGRDRTTREPRYLAVEVSVGLGEGDVLRAADRAAMLSRLTGVPVTPVVAGYSIAPRFRSIADQRNVQVVITESPR